MSSKGPEDGGPAFPAAYEKQGGQLIHSLTSGGMSLRDYFAAQALQGLLQRGVAMGRNLEDAMPITASIAYTLADAMLMERSK